MSTRATSAPTFALHVGITGVLTVGQSYPSTNQVYQLLFQADGNLVFYVPSGEIWRSGTSGDACVVQGDGNMFIYDGGTPTWNSGTYRNPSAYITVFDTGVFAFYDKEGNMLKSYGTGGIFLPRFL